MKLLHLRFRLQDEETGHSIDELVPVLFAGLEDGGDDADDENALENRKDLVRCADFSSLRTFALNQMNRRRIRVGWERIPRAEALQWDFKTVTEQIQNATDQGEDVSGEEDALIKTPVWEFLKPAVVELPREPLSRQRDKKSFFQNLFSCFGEGANKTTSRDKPPHEWEVWDEGRLNAYEKKKGSVRSETNLLHSNRKRSQQPSTKTRREEASVRADSQKTTFRPTSTTPSRPPRPMSEKEDKKSPMRRKSPTVQRPTVEGNQEQDHAKAEDSEKEEWSDADD